MVDGVGEEGLGEGDEDEGGGCKPIGCSMEMLIKYIAQSNI